MMSGAEVDDSKRSEVSEDVEIPESAEFPVGDLRAS
jgi:hypothetical protein